MKMILWLEVSVRNSIKGWQPRKGENQCLRERHVSLMKLP